MSIKPAEPEVKVKATRKTATTAKSKVAVAEVEAPPAVKQAYGASRPVMSLPPPTGQPPKVTGKHTRVPDSAAPRFATLEKREAVKQA